MGWINIAIGVLLLALALVNPLSLWRATRGWTYRDPEANEPSDDALSLGRAGRAIGGVLSIVLGIYVNGGFDHTEDPHAAAQQIAAAVRADGPVDVTIYDDDGSEFEFELDSRLDSALDAARPAAALEIDGATRGAGYVDYTLRDGGRKKFCLTVTETGRSARKEPPTGYATTPGIDVAIQVGLTDGGCRSRRSAGQ